VGAELRRRLDAGLGQIAFLVVPSAMALLALGDVVTAALYQTGKFTHNDSVYVWGILAARRWACWRRRWAAVFFDLLCAPGHAHAAAIRGGACGAHHRAGLPVLDSAAQMARPRSALGRGGFDGVGGRGGMGGVSRCCAGR